MRADLVGESLELLARAAQRLLHGALRRRLGHVRVRVDDEAAHVVWRLLVRRLRERQRLAADAKAAEEKLRREAEDVDLSKLALVRTLEGHSGNVLTTSGDFKILTVTSVITPSNPSDPVISPKKS